MRMRARRLARSDVQRGDLARVDLGDAHVAEMPRPAPRPPRGRAPSTTRSARRAGRATSSAAAAAAVAPARSSDAIRRALSGRPHEGTRGCRRHVVVVVVVVRSSSSSSSSSSSNSSKKRRAVADGRASSDGGARAAHRRHCRRRLPPPPPPRRPHVAAQRVVRSGGGGVVDIGELRLHLHETRAEQLPGAERRRPHERRLVDSPAVPPPSAPLSGWGTQAAARAVPKNRRCHRRLARGEWAQAPRTPRRRRRRRGGLFESPRLALVQMMKGRVARSPPPQPQGVPRPPTKQNEVAEAPCRGGALAEERARRGVSHRARRAQRVRSSQGAPRSRPAADAQQQLHHLGNTRAARLHVPRPGAPDGESANSMEVALSSATVAREPVGRSSASPRIRVPLSHVPLVRRQVIMAPPRPACSASRGAAWRRACARCWSERATCGLDAAHPHRARTGEQRREQRLQQRIQGVIHGVRRESACAALVSLSTS